MAFLSSFTFALGVAFALPFVEGTDELSFAFTLGLALAQHSNVHGIVILLPSAAKILNLQLQAGASLQVRRKLRVHVVEVYEAWPVQLEMAFDFRWTYALQD